mgnify:CR=1 FL=1
MLTDDHEPARKAFQKAVALDTQNKQPVQVSVFKLCQSGELEAKIFLAIYEGLLAPKQLMKCEYSVKFKYNLFELDVNSCSIRMERPVLNILQTNRKPTQKQFLRGFSMSCGRLKASGTMSSKSDSLRK